MHIYIFINIFIIKMISKLYFILFQIWGLYLMLPWRENAHTSVRNTATRIPAGCLDNPHQTAPRVPRAGPSSPPSCLTRRGRVRSAWWLTAAPSLTERSGVEAGATKWPAFAFCLPTLVPILQVVIPVRTAPGRRSPWVRQPITPLPLHHPVKAPKEKSTCDSPAVRLALIPHVIQFTCDQQCLWEDKMPRCQNTW